jgi:hypothetical protein
MCSLDSFDDLDIECWNISMTGADTTCLRNVDAGDEELKVFHQGQSKMTAELEERTHTFPARYFLYGIDNSMKTPIWSRASARKMHGD